MAYVDVRCVRAKCSGHGGQCAAEAPLFTLSAAIDDFDIAKKRLWAHASALAAGWKGFQAFPGLEDLIFCPTCAAELMKKLQPKVE